MLKIEMDKIKYVVDNSKYVSLNIDKVDNVIDAINDFNYKHWSKNINLDLTEEKWILLAFIIESMNFCFWQKPKWKIIYKKEIMSGSNALFYSVIRAIETKLISLDIEYLHNLNKETFLKIFVAVEGNISLIDYRYENFKEVIDVFYNNKNIYKELYSIKSDIELLKFIVKTFKSFNDKSIYNNKVIYFNKRATLLVNDLFHLSKTISSNINNVNNLSGCADYGLPRTFRDYEILNYSSSLKKLIDNEKEISHNSKMEIEIRANTLYAIELIKEKLNKKGLLINSVELDNLIWLLYKSNKGKKSIPHHTTTIYY